MSTLDEHCKEMKWDVDPTDFSFGGPQMIYNIPAGTITFHVALKIEQACNAYAKQVVGSTRQCAQGMCDDVYSTV